MHGQKNIKKTVTVSLSGYYHHLPNPSQLYLTNHRNIYSLRCKQPSK